MSVGALGSFGLKQETTYGTEATPPTVFHEIKSESIASDNNLIIPRYIGGVKGNKRVLPGPYTAEGSFELDATPEGAMGWILKGMCGSAVSSEVVAGVYSHIFTPGQSNDMPSFTIQVDAEAGCRNWLGCQFSSLDITMSPDELIAMAVGVIAQYDKEAIAATPTYSTLDPFTAYDVAVTLNGVSNSTLENLVLNFTNDVEGVKTLNNQRWIGRTSAKNLNVAGTFSLEFNDMDMLRRFWGSSVATQPLKCFDDLTLQIDITSTCQQIGSTGHYYTLSIAIPSFYIATGAPNLTGADDRIMQEIAFVTKHDAVTGKSISFTLKNAQASYPDPA